SRRGAGPFLGIFLVPSERIAGCIVARLGGENTPNAPGAGLLGPLRSVLRAALLAVAGTGRVEGAAPDVVAHARQVLHAAPADEHPRVLLEVVRDAGDVGSHFLPVGAPHAGNFAQRRVRFTRRLGLRAQADAPLLRMSLQGRRLGLLLRLLATLAHQLANRWH